MSEKQNQDSIQENQVTQETIRLDLKAAEPAPEKSDEFVLNMDDTQGLNLEDIMKEFARKPKKGKPAAAVKIEEPETESQAEENEPEPEAAEEAAEEATPESEPASEPEQVTSDTIRLDTVEVEKKVSRVRGAVRIEKDESQEPFSEQWEPEYEQPMGEYVPPQPIQFRPRSRIKELKRKLVAGPEKRYYELAEQGLGKLQLGICLSILVSLIAAFSTVLHYMELVPQERVKLLVFVQFFVMLVSALLGCNQMIEGVSDVFKRRYTCNTMLVLTFVLCCLDGVLGLQQLRVPCCAAFSLAVTLSLCSAHQRRNTEMGQMDTLRKAVRMDGVYVETDYYEKKNGLLRRDSEPEEFTDHYQKPFGPEKVLCWYALFATLLSLGMGVAAYLMHGLLFEAVQVSTVCMLAAMPVSAFVTISRPTSVLQRKLHNAGAVICGWQGVKALSKKAVFPVEYSDLFPVGAARMNGVKFFGSRPTDEVVAYCTSLIVANGSGLAPLFDQVLTSRNGYHYDCQDLQCHENGGLSGVVEGEQVLVGSMGFLKEMGVEIPGGMRVNQAVCVAIEGELAGLFALNYENTRSAMVGMSGLSSLRGAHPIFVSGDFLLSKNFLCSRFGLKPRRLHFPDAETRAQLQQRQPDEEKSAAMLVTREGLASFAVGIVGAKALKKACVAGVVVHMIGGILGLAIMALLTLMGRMDLLAPMNLFLYQLVWMIPGLLITEWTRVI